MFTPFKFCGVFHVGFLEFDIWFEANMRASVMLVTVLMLLCAPTKVDAAFRAIPMYGRVDTVDYHERFNITGTIVSVFDDPLHTTIPYECGVSYDSGGENTFSFVLAKTNPNFEVLASVLLRSFADHLPITMRYCECGRFHAMVVCGITLAPHPVLTYF